MFDLEYTKNKYRIFSANDHVHLVVVVKYVNSRHACKSNITASDQNYLRHVIAR